MEQLVLLITITYNEKTLQLTKYKRYDRLRAPTTLKSEGEVTSLSGADKREVRDDREKW
jgi:hypothetical protein